MMKELVEALKAKWLSGEREALFKWAHDPEIAGGMLKLLGAEGDPDLLIFGVKYWLEWLVRGSLAPPDFPEALIPAARLYAEVTLEPYRDVLMRIYRRLGEIRIHYAQRLREVVEAELRRIGALPEGAKPPEKRPEEVKRPAERPLERPAKAAKPAEGLAEAAKPSTEAIEKPAKEAVEKPADEEARRPLEKPAAVEKPAERPSPAAEKTAEGRPAEVKKPAAGLIPEGLFGVQAALWLRRRLGSRDVGYEEARWLGEAVRKAKDYALWKALRGKAPETPGVPRGGGGEGLGRSV
ncbi:hypothetical protein [Pyrobaculum aerophilum]|nr:hypothetical protein [Pyrobaculum aerophilum]